jgi:hypothetical protein
VPSSTWRPGRSPYDVQRDSVITPHTQTTAE